MIDTVAILLEQEDFEIIKPEKFSPSAKGLIQAPYYPFSSQGFIRCINNPTKDEVNKHGYLPKLTIFARQMSGYEIQLKIEFSAPKIIFGNNFEELEDEDFELLIYELKEKLEIMGIATTENRLKLAKVTSIHYSKNILLDKNLSCYQILKQLSKVNLNKKIDISNTDYRNDGHAVRFHTNSYQIVFYDKLKDLEKSKISDKRAIENDNRIQHNIINENQGLNKNDVLRLEIRLTSRSLSKTLKAIGIEKLTSFRFLFNRTISRKILMHYLYIILDCWIPFNELKILPEDLYVKIKRSSKFKPNKILQMLGALYIIDSIGYLGLRNLTSTHSNRSWYRLKSELNQIDLNNDSDLIPLAKLIEEIRCFSPIKLEHLK